MLDRPLIPADLDPLADPGGKHRVPVMAISDLDTLGMDRERLRRQKLAEQFARIDRHGQQRAVLRRLALPHLGRTQAAQRAMRRVMIDRDLAQQPALEFHKRHRRVRLGIIAVARRHVRSGRTGISRGRRS